MNSTISGINDVYYNSLGAGAGKTTGNSSVPFSNLFADAISDYEQLEAANREVNYNLAIGDIDDLGEIATSAEKAQTALYMLINMRNKLLDSYSEIMRINM